MEATLEQKIKTALKDATSGMATTGETRSFVLEEIAKEFEKQKVESLKSLADAQEAVTELKKTTDSMESQIKTLVRSRFASIKSPGGSYNGAWGTLDHAKNFGLWVLAYVANNPGARKTCEDLGIEARFVDPDGNIVKAMGPDYPSTGGALVPTEFIPHLIVLMESYGVFRRNTTVWPMSSGSGYAPEQTGDVTVYCPGFGTAPTKSDAAFRNIGLQTQKWMTLTAIDSELQEDAAIAVGEIVGRSIARAFAKKEDQCGFIGDGTSTYFGRKGARVVLREVDATVTNVAGLHVQATPGVWSAIVLGDLLALPGMLLGDADDGIDAKWYCNKNFYYTVIIAKALAAGGVRAKEVTQTGYLAKPMFLGRPVEFAQVMPRVKASADHCPLLLANLRQGSFMGDRRRLTVDQSKDVYYAEDQIGIRGTERVAPTIYGVGNTTDPSAIVGLWADIA